MFSWKSICRLKVPPTVGRFENNDSKKISLQMCFYGKNLVSMWSLFNVNLCDHIYVFVFFLFGCCGSQFMCPFITLFSHAYRTYWHLFPLSGGRLLCYDLLATDRTVPWIHHNRIRTLNSSPWHELWLFIIPGCYGIERHEIKSIRLW